MDLPESFIEKMRAQLGPELGDFLAGYERPAYRGVRLNPLKCTEETLRGALPFELGPSGFAKTSFYADWQGGFGQLPAHHAGMFYSQEPSASSAVTALEPQPGERILDLCAAPGGKATQIAGELLGSGLIWANETVRGRAGALLSNMERLGVANGVISCCHPQALCQGLRGYFDRVLVDAPCSGEGMFRREPGGIAQWSPQGVAACAQRQLAILDSAALAVREGGVLVYSTCTFSTEENEGAAAGFLKNHPEFVQEPIEQAFGRPDLDRGLARRVYPMDGGEGHFVAKFRRIGENSCAAGAFRDYLPKKQSAQALELYGELFSGPAPEALIQHGEAILIPPAELPELRGLGVLRAGVELCYQRRGRLEPAHGAFMSRSGRDCRSRVELSGQKMLDYLHGQEAEVEDAARGYMAVCLEGVTVGFGKASGGRLKNRYPKGLRML